MKNKKKYIVPFTYGIEIETAGVIAGSADGEVHIPDVGWGSSRHRGHREASSSIWGEN